MGSYAGIDKKACEGRSCCWHPFIDVDNKGGPRLEQPSCFFTNTAQNAYAVTDVNETAAGVEALLELRKEASPELGVDLKYLKLEADTRIPDILRVRITDPHDKRWEVPRELLAQTPEEVADANSKAEPHKYRFDYTPEPFSFEVTRTGPAAAPGEPALWNTTGLRMLYKDQYLELTSWVPPTSTIYGLGERISSSGLKVGRNGRPLAMWNRDCTDYPDLNLYGSHPFVLEVREDGSAHGMLLFNSNGMDAVVTEDKVSWRVTGGVLDIFIFPGPNPMQVLEQYTRLFGRPAMPPLWALGFHQSKYGYASIWEMQEVVDNYTAADIPLDTMWGDIDYMEHQRDFTFDPVNFPLPAVQAREFVERLHNNSQRFVPILDPGIPLLPGFPAYEDGLKRGIFITDVTGQPYIAEVWPGAVHFPDFINPEGQAWWLDHIRDFHALVPFDGLWVDMNEVSNFCTGHVCELPPDGILDFVDPSVGKPFFTFGTEPPACRLQCWSLEPYLKQWLLQEQSTRNMPGSINGNAKKGAFIGSLVKGVAETVGTRAWQEPELERAAWEIFLKVDAPPYSIANNNVRLPLSFRTMPVTARHYDGSLQYNTHNLYGLSQAAATARALHTLHDGAKRPFVLTRRVTNLCSRLSTFVGSGGYAAHWTGDNAATWDDLRWSVVGVLEAGILGMPMAGADICGFLGITTEELCARWISAGAFYPFARSHSDLTSGYQELYRWPKVTEAGRNALGLRYQLLPYLYTAFRHTAGHGCPLARPLFFGWPQDATARDVDSQWLMGDSVLVTPVLDEGAESVQGYFPQGVWYDISDETPVDASTAGRFVRLPAPLTHLPVHVLGGAVVPMQEARMTTAETLQTPLTLLVAFPRLPMQGAPREALRCGPAPPDSAALGGTASRSLVAWGQLYTDRGDQVLDVAGGVDSGFINFRAKAQPDGTGILSGTFSADGEWDEAHQGECAEGLPWPLLDRVRVLGLPGRIDPASIIFETLAPGKIHPATTQKLSPSQVSQEEGRIGQVDITGLSLELDCPLGFRLLWMLEKPHNDEL
ncbi:hypothetical protein COCSUDRAFT_64412 [Coccomyxa subellipsoidea C-169]|uniref:Maltase n=1 Tax=Coccomyxa subellipsoidea (strain C-169) TaxID=574566 RepID=I0Z6J4_COCSC|nr:hypothetical protein COCSUDRAFT_64412 [Coccomyxa subellipsoidea C-169]EIE26263.1 hypothetical protein COCSUDRAFT_64412 [Coccomyxa subellipsoidea C-169]|eukprot:XP_005650807.1 hypothetical protein COCSUDRAFT_64412 [Coccomyxa subellipsoidea C-169]